MALLNTRSLWNDGAGYFAKIIVVKVKVKLDVKVTMAAAVECSPVYRLLVYGDVDAGCLGVYRRTCCDDVTSG